MALCSRYRFTSLPNDCCFDESTGGRAQSCTNDRHCWYRHTPSPVVTIHATSSSLATSTSIRCFLTHFPGILPNLVVLQVHFSLLNTGEILYYKAVYRVQIVTEELGCNFQYLTFLVFFKLTSKQNLRETFRGIALRVYS